MEASVTGSSMPVAGGELAARALVVLDVAGALHALWVEVALELGEDLAVGLADDVGKDVQAAAMGHAEHRFLDPALRRLVEDGVEKRDRRLGAFEPEALLADIAGVQEALEGLGGVQPLEDMVLLLWRAACRARPRRGAGSSASASGSWMCMYSMPMVRQ